jgi:hypothetical protein
MLKLAILMITYSRPTETYDFDDGINSHAEAANLDQDTFQYAKMFDFDHDIFQTC